MQPLAERQKPHAALRHSVSTHAEAVAMGWTVLEPFETAVNCIAATALLEKEPWLP